MDGRDRQPESPSKMICRRIRRKTSWSPVLKACVSTSLTEPNPTGPEKDKICEEALSQMTTPVPANSGFPIALPLKLGFRNLPGEGGHLGKMSRIEWRKGHLIPIPNNHHHEDIMKPRMESWRSKGLHRASPNLPKNPRRRISLQKNMHYVLDQSHDSDLNGADGPYSTP